MVRSGRTRSASPVGRAIVRRKVAVYPTSLIIEGYRTGPKFVEFVYKLLRYMAERGPQFHAQTGRSPSPSAPKPKR
jgi:hypothetical protein